MSLKIIFVPQSTSSNMKYKNSSLSLRCSFQHTATLNFLFLNICRIQFPPSFKKNADICLNPNISTTM